MIVVGQWVDIVVVVRMGMCYFWHNIYLLDDSDFDEAHKPE
jgi:hypothetical protein